MAPEALEASARWLLAGLSDWARLLGGPRGSFNPSAQYPTTNDWKRVLRLALIAAILSAAVEGTAAVSLKNIGDGTVALAFSTPLALLLIMAAALLMLPYCFVAVLFCRLPVTVPQAVVTFLLFSLPWLPLAALVAAFGRALPLAGVVTFLFFWGMLSAILVNFARGMALVATTCPRWRVWGSVALFAILAAFLFVWVMANTTIPVALQT